MEKDNFFGAMDNTIQVNGSKVKRMEVDIGKVQQDKAIWDNGKTDQCLVMESKRKMITRNMKDNFQTLLKMVQENKNFQMVIYLREIIVMESLRGLGRISGKKAIVFRVSFIRDIEGVLEE